MSNFEFKDRRQSVVGDEPVVEEAKVLTMPEKKPGEWKDVCFCVAMANLPDGRILVMGRAVGLRMDGLAFMADWLFPSLWKPGFDWTAKAKERLDTFLTCECTHRAPCVVHKVTIPNWMKADEQRMNLAGTAAIPESLEAYMKAEQAAQQSKIIVPR